MREAIHIWGLWYMGNLCASAQFYCEPKTAPVNNVFLKKRNKVITIKCIDLKGLKPNYTKKI